MRDVSATRWACVALVALAWLMLAGGMTVPALAFDDPFPEPGSGHGYDHDTRWYDTAPNLARSTVGATSRSIVTVAGAANHSGPSLASSGVISAPRAADEFVDLSSSSRRTHILHGDATGGGHLYPGLAGKSPFPQSWSGDRILHEISDIATDPAAWRNAIGQGNRTVLTGTRGGVDIRVIVDTRTGQIISGYPTNIPRNPR